MLLSTLSGVAAPQLESLARPARKPRQLVLANHKATLAKEVLCRGSPNLQPNKPRVKMLCKLYLRLTFNV